MGRAYRGAPMRKRKAGNALRVRRAPLCPSSRDLGVLVPCLVVAIYAWLLQDTTILGDTDTYWHVAAGNWILDHHAIPYTDPFAFPTLGRPWVAHEWLAEILMALVFHAGGWAGLIAMSAATSTLSIGIFAHYLQRWLDPVPAYVLLMLTIVSMAPIVLARPHILTMPIMTFWVAKLVTAREAGRPPPLPLALLMVPWANMHGGFLSGMAFAGFFAGEAVLAARVDWLKAGMAWSPFLLASAAAMLMTPHGFEGILFPIQLLRMPALLGITEWQPPNFHNIEAIELIIVTALVLGWTWTIRLPWTRVLFFLLLIHSALRHTRFQVQLALVGFLALAPMLGTALNDGRAEANAPPRLARRRIALLACAAILVLTVVRIAVHHEKPNGGSSPLQALAAVPESVRRLPVFNYYYFGGFLIFHGVRPFVDGRADLFGDTFLTDYINVINIDPVTMERVFRQYDIAWTMLAPGMPLSRLMDRLPGWTRVHADGFAVVHIRTDMSIAN